MLKHDLSNLAIFQGLEGCELEHIAPLVNLCYYGSEDVIFEQDQAAVYLYILLEGEVVISYKPYDGPPLTVARISPGGVFGWSAALRREKYTSAAIAATSVTAICMSSDELKKLCQTNPHTGELLLDHLAAAIAQRLNSTHSQILSILVQGMDIKPDEGERDDR